MTFHTGWLRLFPEFQWDDYQVSLNGETVVATIAVTVTAANQ